MYPLLKKVIFHSHVSFPGVHDFVLCVVISGTYCSSLYKGLVQEQVERVDPLWHE